MVFLKSLAVAFTSLFSSSSTDNLPADPPLFHNSRQAQSTIELYDTYSSGDAFGIEQYTISLSQGEASDASTGVSHFRHVHTPHLVTFVFSNGRHEASGINSYVTVDFNRDNPFEGATETLIDSEIGGGAYTWVSTSTITQTNNILVKHNVLFSGGNDRDGVIFPSALYSFQENIDGSLQAPVWEWSSTPELPARFGKLVDLGNIPLFPDDPASPLASRAGNFDIIIAGYGGLDIYSLQEDGVFLRIRDIPVIGPTAATYVGVDLYNPSNSLDQSVLVVVNRSEWRFTGMLFDAPCFLYDYRTNQHFHYFAQQGQTVSVAVIDDNEQMLVGAGGNDRMKGQPNLMFQFTENSEIPACELSPTQQQLMPGVPTTYEVMMPDDNTPTPDEAIAALAVSGLTKTRQVFPFRLPGYSRDYIVEVNSAQPAYIYCRNEQGETFRIIPLPHTRGEAYEIWARAADVLVEESAVYIAIAMNSGENLVYKVKMELLLDASAVTPAPSPSPTTAVPTVATASPSPAPTMSSPISPGVGSPTTGPGPQPPQQKEAPLAPKCGSVASSSGYGGVGGESKGCTRRQDYGSRKRIRGR